MLLLIFCVGASTIVTLIFLKYFNAFYAKQLEKISKKCCAGNVKLPTVSYEKALPYLRGNPYITDGYRQYYSLRQTLQSLFSIHNETANIWSHFLGFLLFAYFSLLAIWDLIRHEENADIVHQITVVIFTSGAVCLLVASTTFHWLGCMSDEVYELTAKLDYTGIALMILVSFFPFMYGLFYCRIWLGIFYSLCITTLTGLAVFVSWSETFNKPGYHRIRAGVFIAVGLFGGVPLPHACISLGLSKSWPVAWPLLLMGATYIFGAVLYAFRIPERFFPGKLNIIGHSHFLFHCCVIAAAYLHYWNVNRIIDWRLVHNVC